MKHVILAAALFAGCTVEELPGGGNPAEAAPPEVADASPLLRLDTETLCRWEGHYEDSTYVEAVIFKNGVEWARTTVGGSNKYGAPRHRIEVVRYGVEQMKRWCQTTVDLKAMFEHDLAVQRQRFIEGQDPPAIPDLPPDDRDWNIIPCTEESPGHWRCGDETPEALPPIELGATA